MREIFRDASTGRFIPKSVADRNPATTVTEWVGDGGDRFVYRSAVTGKFVKEATAQRHPAQTIRQKV